MLAGPKATISRMRRAVAHTLAVLDAAAEVDVDRSEEDREFFVGLAEEVRAHDEKLEQVEAAIIRHDLRAGAKLQARVLMGDAALDVGIRHANARIKLGLAGRPGLDARHVFGDRIDELTNAPMEEEPRAALEATARLDHLDEFAEKAAIKVDLVARAKNQERFLLERGEGYVQRARLVSEGHQAVVQAAQALVRTRGALEGRFPHQTLYVRRFFMDVTSRRAPAPPPPEPVPALPAPAQPV